MSCMIWECIMQHCDECRRPVVFVDAHGSIYFVILRHCDDVERQECSVQYTRLFGVCNANWNAFYSVP